MKTHARARAQRLIHEAANATLVSSALVASEMLSFQPTYADDDDGRLWFLVPSGRNLSVPLLKDSRLD